MKIRARSQNLAGSVRSQIKRLAGAVCSQAKQLAVNLWSWIQRVGAIPYFALSANFLGAVAFALAHHGFYQSLANTPPSSDNSILSGFLQNASGQSVNIAIGTLFATIVAALLGLCAQKVHDQVSWRAIKANPAELSLLDGLLTRDIWSPRLWKRYPGSETVAFMCW